MSFDIVKSSWPIIDAQTNVLGIFGFCNYSELYAGNDWDKYMIIVIDGYNVLKQVDANRKIGKEERGQFIQMLSNYHHRKKHAIVLVFDGGPCTWPSKEVIAKVKVVYSGFKKTADAVIMDYIKNNHAKDVLLVSSDNELARYAQKFDLVSIGSEEFYYLLQEALRNPFEEAVEDVHVEIDESIEDLDELMQAGSSTVPVKAEDQLHQETPLSSKRKSSKQERALLKKLQKL